jgi:hypothetical protein
VALIALGLFGAFGLLGTIVIAFQDSFQKREDEQQRRRWRPAR